MLDQRLHNTVYRRDNYYVWMTREANIKFHFSNAFSEKLIVQKLNQILQKLDNLNGEPISDRTLIRGVKNRVNDIPLRERIKTESQSQEEKNQHLEALRKFEAEHNADGTKKTEQQIAYEAKRAEMLAEAQAWQKKKDDEAAQLEMESDPQWRARHVAAGESFLLAHYLDVPESIYQASLNRLKAVADPEKFAELDKDFKARQAKRLAEREDALKAERAKLDAELQTLNMGTEAKAPSYEAWELARKEAAQLKQGGMYPQARDEIAILYDGVHAGTIEPREFQQRVKAIREVANATG